MLPFLLAAALLVGCGGDGGSNRPTTVEVKRGDDTLAEWNAARIREELQLQQVTVRGQTYEGPRLTDLLAASDAGEWVVVAVRGKGPNLTLDVAETVRFTEAESAGHILNLNSDGTFRLIAPGVHESRWVRRITAIELQDQ